MERELYPAARTVAPKLEAYFRHRADSRRAHASRLATAPDAETIEALINAAFWASLRREEGYMPRISLAYLSPAETAQPLTFERPLALSAEALTRVAPAVERPGIHLGVSRDADAFSVWGTTRAIPPHCFVLEVEAPGLLVVKHSGDESGKFVNVAVLEGDRIKFVDEHATSMPDCPALLTSLLGFDSLNSWGHSVNVLVQLAVSMRAHGRGGLLLIVPSDGDAWRESIVQPIMYAVAPSYTELARLTRETPGEKEKALWQEALGRAVEEIAGFTAVDGAVILTDRYELMGFGAKIARRKGWGQVDQVQMTEPIEGGVAVLAHPEELGGTRHLSAAQFVHDQRNALALVASQDGRFTIFEWSSCEAMVHAHRIEALLL